MRVEDIRSSYQTDKEMLLLLLLDVNSMFSLFRCPSFSILGFLRKRALRISTDIIANK